MGPYNDTLRASFSWSANAHVIWELCSTISLLAILGFNCFCNLSLSCGSEDIVYATSITAFHYRNHSETLQTSYACLVHLQMVTRVMFE